MTTPSRCAGFPHHQALKELGYETIMVNPDFIIKPIDGFGDRNLLRMTLATEKPDLILIFTDPRFFIWLFEMEDEIHQVCPIVWWHVWDNRPAPVFNGPMYEATDLINCHSYMTYEIVKEMFPEKTIFQVEVYQFCKKTFTCIFFISSYLF
jgi:hypothetical protein